MDQVCRGFILTVFERDGVKNPSKSLASVSADFKLDPYTRSVNKVDFYQNLDDLGFYFGHLFQSLDSVIYSGEGRAAASLDLM